jgi:hypothetical protein
MKVQVIEDSNGKPAGVFIPMKDWRDLEKKLTLRREEIRSPSKKQLISELKEAILELTQIEKGEKKARPVEELLNEL